MIDDPGLAYERTMLAWRRFALSFAAAGLGAAKLAATEIPAAVAVTAALAVSGGAGIVVALTVPFSLRPGPRRSSTVFASVVGAAAVALLGLVAVMLRL